MTRNREESLALLIRQERLDRFAELLCERAWDEVPLWSRIDPLRFLSDGGVVPARVARVGTDILTSE